MGKCSVPLFQIIVGQYLLPENHFINVQVMSGQKTELEDGLGTVWLISQCS